MKVYFDNIEKYWIVDYTELLIDGNRLNSICSSIFWL